MTSPRPKKQIEVGSNYPTWFSGSPDGMSRVIEMRPYIGRYPQYFDAVLRLSAPATQKGWVEMSVKTQHHG